MRQVKWKEVSVGDVMEDGSTVTQLHPIHEAECYEIEHGNLFDRKTMTLSGDHLLLCDLKRVKKSVRKEIIEVMQDFLIPNKMDYVIETGVEISDTEKAIMSEYLTGKEEDLARDIVDKHEIIDDILEKSELKEVVVEEETAAVGGTMVWLHVKIIARLVMEGYTIKCNNRTIKRVRYVGIKKARCVSTDTGRYESKALVHHNSVAVRNIIFHALTHSQDMSAALVDLKQTEFTYFKGIKGVVGVANEVQEAAELMRIARAVMYKRNREMAKLGITDMADFEPQKPTDKVFISGREFHEDQVLKVRVEGEEKEVTAKELLEIVNSI